MIRYYASVALTIVHYKPAFVVKKKNLVSHMRIFLASYANIQIFREVEMRLIKGHFCVQKSVSISCYYTSQSVYIFRSPWSQGVCSCVIWELAEGSHSPASRPFWIFGFTFPYSSSIFGWMDTTMMNRAYYIFNASSLLKFLNYFANSLIQLTKIFH